MRSVAAVAALAILFACSPEAESPTEAGPAILVPSLGVEPGEDTFVRVCKVSWRLFRGMPDDGTLGREFNLATTATGGTVVAPEVTVTAADPSLEACPLVWTHAGVPFDDETSVSITEEVPPASSLDGAFVWYVADEVGSPYDLEGGSTVSIPPRGGAFVFFENSNREYDCAVQNQIPVVECEALVALFESTDGPNWVNHDGWLEDTAPCNWFGVSCPGIGPVQGLLLENNNLSGPLPSEIGNLTQLASLHADRNNISGELPVEIGRLGRLVSLRLRFNDLVGGVPEEVASMSRLRFLDLGANGLSGAIPPELGELPNLQSLELHSNELSGPIPPELADLESLEHLRLTANALVGTIPPELGNLTNLLSLRLNQNRLVGDLPVELSNLTALTVLSLSNNLLTGPLPVELGGMAELSFLFLNSNRLSGQVPLAVAALGARATNCQMAGNTLFIPDTPPYRELTDPPGQPICGIPLGG